MGFVCLLFIHRIICIPVPEQPRGEFCMLWYNVENLFNPLNDSLPADDEFTPEGLRHWTWSRYRQKLTALARVIIASGRGEPPELVALCEVENARVLEDLANHPVLEAYQYHVLHRDSPDHRGMDLGCLIRPARIRLLDWGAIPFAHPVKETRDLLHLTLGCRGDTLDLFLVHLVSKYGGAGATADLRRCQAEQLAALVDSVYAGRPCGLILAAGDFNEEYPGYAMEPLRMARFGTDSLTPLMPLGEQGTYKYRGRWSFIDQVLVLQSLSPGAIRVSSPDLAPLLIEDLEFGGMKPRRTYEGYRYLGGISDHLPQVIDLNPSLF